MKTIFYDIEFFDQHAYIVDKGSVITTKNYTVVERLVDGKLTLWTIDNINDIDQKNQYQIVATNNLNVVQRIHCPKIPDLLSMFSFTKDDMINFTEWIYFHTVEYFRGGTYSVLPSKISGLDDKTTYTVNELLEHYLKINEKLPVQIELEVEECAFVLPEEPEGDNWIGIASEALAVLYRRPIIESNNIVKVKSLRYKEKAIFKEIY